MKFEEIYSTYWQQIFRLCMGYVNDRELARDLTQETFVSVWRQLPNFRHESSISTWIFRIASNQCLRQVEKQKRFQGSSVIPQLKDEETISREPEIQLLYRFVSELPEVDRLIISMELEDIKQAEIALVVGLSESNVRVRIHRIKEKLAKKFKEYAGEY